MDDRFLILQFYLKLGKRTIPLWYKIFNYKEKGNKSFEHVKQGISELNEIFTPYDYEILLLADRGFKSIDLFRYIDDFGWKYCIRCTNDMIVKIEDNQKVRYPKDINPIKNRVKKFNDILLSEKEYKCNLAVCRGIESEDIWYLANNMNSKIAVTEYKKRFDIEEMFRDLSLMDLTWKILGQKVLNTLKIYIYVYVQLILG
ncbi:transposase [Tissierella sp. P1]|uniref:transposase n=1 Tax=Tissierella sp. P1 TaxID=1280483 RepID=UPI001303543F|nr:transposase [Tissierella sp. P1]